MFSVSIVIPTRNRISLLQRAIQSVLLQTYNDWELLIVDDASTDKTESYFQHYKNDRLKYIRLDKKSGGAVARNTGIREAQGKLVAFLDDDDEWLPEKLKKQVECLFKNKDCGICYTGRKIVTNGDSIAGLTKSYSFKSAPNGNHFRAIMSDNFVGVTSSVIIPRNILLQLNGFDEKLPCYQDYDLFIRILKNYIAIGINEPLVNYYIESNIEHVSFTHKKVIIASEYLIEKYKDEHYCNLLKKALTRIKIKKMMKSVVFAKEVFQYHLKKLVH